MPLTYSIFSREGKLFVVQGALIQRCKNLGEAAMKALFACTQGHWNVSANYPHWNGLTSLGVDGIIWLTDDSSQCNEAFTKAINTQYPQVTMVCQMDEQPLITGAF